MYVYMYKRSQAIARPCYRDFVVKGTTLGTGYRYPRPHRHRPVVTVKVPIVIPNAKIVGYVEDYPLYSQEDFVKYLPNIQNIEDEVVVKVVGG